MSIIDNHNRGSVGNFLKDRIQEKSTLSIASAYFTIYSFEVLKEKLIGIKSLKFLFGEPRFIKALDPEKTDKKSFSIQDEGLQLQNQLQQKRVAKECSEWIEKKAEVRSVRQSNLLHGKMYHIANHKGEDAAMMGSSNFTLKGLGLGATGNNIELNIEVESSNDRDELKAWFDELWNNEELVEDVKKEVLLYLAQLYQNNAPQFIYYKTLFHVFEQFLVEQDQSELSADRSQLVDTEIWKTLFEFQKHGVKGAINKILKYNGCIIADSVGLGKTYEALAVIKYFELRNERVLVLCPKKLRENWTVYQAQNNSPLNLLLNDRFSYTVLSHTDLSRDSGISGDVNLATINWGNYDLVVIDESHNFRNDTKGKKDDEGNVIKKSRYEKLMDSIIKSGVKTKVLLLSATPVNNDLKDLRNQLYLIAQDDSFRDSLGIDSLGETLDDAQQKFKQWAQQPNGERKTIDLLEKLNSAFFKLLDELTIARSRKHIQKYYKDTLEELGGFPVREHPESIFSEIDTEGKFMSYDQLHEKISDYQLSVFNPSKYVLPHYRSLYEEKRVKNFKQSDREYFLIGMMKVNFLKRLESSVNSLAITLKRTLDKIEELQQDLKRFKGSQEDNREIAFNDIKIDAEEGEEDDEDLREAWEVGKNLKFKMTHLDIERWLQDLEEDKKRLTDIWHKASDISTERDAKLGKLKELIANKINFPTTNRRGDRNRKVLVFTAFADTASYLYNALREWASQKLGIHIALVTGEDKKTTFGKNDFNEILTNFSPISKKRKQIQSKSQLQEEEIELLIATDCISEGQNLQDCDYLINYDIHWNPVRIIQRFGRIDRIGSLNHKVQMINFWPTDDLDKYLDLRNRVEARMALVDITATSEDHLLESNDLKALIKDDLTYRDKQLRRLKEEVLDIEDFSESISLNEFTLDDFRIELTKYLESNRKQLQNAPLGLYAVVPTKTDSPTIAPGVVFCLKQKNDSPDSGNENINPLQPYFLIYVREADKEVRFSFAQPKQILEMYRLLCAERTTPYEKLCDLFDQQTDNGADMNLYNNLLQRAIESIACRYKKRGFNHLLSSRSAILPKQDYQVTDKTNFELITWLVIQ